MFRDANSAASLKDFADTGYNSATHKVGEVALVDTATTLTNAPADSSGVTTLLARLTSARAGYIDNLNVGGAVASHADVLAINQSASKHLLLQTVGQYAPGETYTIEMRTFAAADGSAVNADVTPTLTATGNVSGSLNANLSAATNPATGVYRWTYTPGASPTLEQIRFDGSATISAATFTLACYAQTVDEPSVVWTATDQTHLTAVYNKLPANNIADETLVLAAVGSPMQAGAHVQVATAQDQYAPSKAGDAMALTSGERTSTVAALFAAISEGTESFIQTIRIIRSSVAGVLTGAETATLTTKDAANSKARITATVDGAGNRTAVSTDGT